MRIEFWTVGKTRINWIRQGQSDYLDRCKRFARIEHIILPAEKSGNAQHIRNQESARITDRLVKAPKMHTILLDERGVLMDSNGLANHLRKTADLGGNRLRFVIGGAYGVNEAVRTAVNDTLSLSQMTFPHELVRIIFLEQLYRAFTILWGESYHHS